MNVFFDIETLTVNRKSLRPSDLKTVVFSAAYIIDRSLKVHIKSNIESCLRHLVELAKINKQDKVMIFAHNTSKYDTHFVLAELVKMGFTNYLNIKNNMVTPDDGDYLKQGELKDYQCLELRYKSSNKLSLCFKLDGVYFEMVDTLPKTILSLAAIGKRLNKLGLLDSKYLKTDFDYTKYDLDYNLTDEELNKYASAILDTLSDDELTYIKNDVIILQCLVNNFSKFFDGFSIKEFALNGNVINKYTDDKSDKIATHHILNKIYDKRLDDKYIGISYSEYVLPSGSNLFKFFKNSYRGGVCFYNDNYIGETVTDTVHAYDINSSYPAVLYKNKVPHKVISCKANQTLTAGELSYKQSETYSIFSISLDDFKEITSVLRDEFRKITNSYYKTYSNVVHINSLFIDELIYIHGFKKSFKINVIDCVTFDLAEWGGKRYLKKYYEIKQNSKRFNKTYLEMNDKGEMIPTKKIIDTDESYMTDVSKVLLNSIYGASGISDYVDYFYHDTENNLVRCENGIKNNERNIVSSLFVTSCAKFNLLYPLKDLTNDELSDGFLYCDTDSLYIKESVSDKISKNMTIDPDNIGAWGCDSKSITRFKPLNHKIYAYYDEKKNKITCKMCGVSKNKVSEMVDSCNGDWDIFVDKMFHENATLPSIKSILNKQGTISIYDSNTVLKLGSKYMEHFTFNERIKFFNTVDELYNSFNQTPDINDESDFDSTNDAAIVFYINGGAYSKNEIIQIYREVNHITDVGVSLGFKTMECLINEDYPHFLSYMKNEELTLSLVENLVKNTGYTHKKQSASKSKYTCKYKTNYLIEYLTALYELKLFNLVSLKNREYDILKQMIHIIERKKQEN